MKNLIKKWRIYLDNLDMDHKGFEIFDHTSERLSIKDLRIIIKGGLKDLNKKIDDLRSLNENVEYAMFKSIYRAFLNIEGVEYYEPGSEEDLRNEFKCHVNWNVERLFDFNVLLMESRTYEVSFNGEHNEIDESDPEQKEFRDRALMYIYKKDLNKILEDSWDGSGFFGIIINGYDIIKAIKDNNNIVSSSEMVIGIHDGFNGDGNFKRVSIREDEDKGKYIIALDKAELDWGKYSIGGSSTSEVDWEWE